MPSAVEFCCAGSIICSVVLAFNIILGNISLFKGGQYSMMCNNFTNQRYQTWDKKSITSGPSPWKESCQFKEVNTMGTSFTMCIRSYDDVVSSTIRNSGKWGDCDELVQLWNLKSHSSQLAQQKDSVGVFVDAGANIGSCSLLMAAVGTKTIGFEPSRSNFFYLTSSAMANNQELRERMNMYLMGLSENITKAPVYVAKGNAGNSQLMLTPNSTVVSDHGGQIFTSEESTIVSTLDDVLWPDPLAPPPHIKVMKIDVQGFEVKLLKGAKRLLEIGAIGIIKSELAEQWLVGQGTSSIEYLTILKQYGFKYLEGDKLAEINPYNKYPWDIIIARSP